MKDNAERRLSQNLETAREMLTTPSVERIGSRVNVLAASFEKVPR
jgi:hypothetical protein